MYAIGDEVYLENGLIGTIQFVFAEPYRTYYKIETKNSNGAVRYSKSSVKRSHHKVI